MEARVPDRATYRDGDGRTKEKVDSTVPCHAATRTYHQCVFCFRQGHRRSA